MEARCPTTLLHSIWSDLLGHFNPFMHAAVIQQQIATKEVIKEKNQKQKITKNKMIKTHDERVDYTQTASNQTWTNVRITIQGQKCDFREQRVQDHCPWIRVSVYNAILLAFRGYKTF